MFVRELRRDVEEIVEHHLRRFRAAPAFSACPSASHIARVILQKKINELRNIAGIQKGVFHKCAGKTFSRDCCKGGRSLKFYRSMEKKCNGRYTLSLLNKFSSRQVTPTHHFNYDARN